VSDELMAIFNNLCYDCNLPGTLLSRCFPLELGQQMACITKVSGIPVGKPGSGTLPGGFGGPSAGQAEMIQDP
jgi:hypothetical protein